MYLTFKYALSNLYKYNNFSNLSVDDTTLKIVSVNRLYSVD